MISWVLVSALDVYKDWLIAGVMATMSIALLLIGVGFVTFGLVVSVLSLCIYGMLSVVERNMVGFVVATTSIAVGMSIFLNIAK